MPALTVAGPLIVFIRSLAAATEAARLRDRDDAVGVRRGGGGN